MAASTTPQLVGLTGEYAGKAFPIGDGLLIGRMDTADLRIANLEVSRRHCQIERLGVRFQVRDLNSRSGTRLNDAPVQTSEIQPGDLLAVGPHVFRFEAESSDRPAAAAGGSATMGFDSLQGQMTLKEILLRDFNLAQQLRSATEQATLERLRQHLELVQEFADEIQTTLDTAALIERTLDELFRVFHKMDAGVIFLRDESTGQLTPAAIRRRQQQLSGPVGYSTTILKFVEAEQKAVLNLDVSQDVRFQHAVSVQMGSMRTHMCVPLVVRGEVVGAIYLVAEGDEQPASGFDADDLSLLSALSGTVAVCVKNASLAREAQRSALLSSGLQRYVSADVTRRLIQTGVEGALGAHVSEGIAMFCDLVGFTTLSERLTPDRMVKILNRYFRRALEIVFARQGSVNKFGGDSFLAVWGAIDPAPADISNVVIAALEVQNDTFRLSSELAAEGLDPLQLTIGLNRGRFFAGDIGSDDRMEFTVIGDSVNVAARIQALAHAGQVLASLDSLDAARSRLGVLLYPDIAIRGRGAAVTIASVRSIVTHQSEQNARLLTHVPVELPELKARGVLVGAVLGGAIELDLLCDQPGRAGETYQLIPLLPEWEGTCSPAEVICLASRPDHAAHLVKVELNDLTDQLRATLLPGSDRVATRSLRKKSQ